MTLRVGVLGATGAVGQRFVQLLEGHPTFELAAVTASDESAGRPYRESATWRIGTGVPEYAADMAVRPTAVGAIPDDLDLLFSALPSGVAAEIEPELAAAGHVVSSNASNERMAPDVPLTIPEVNPDHLGLLDVQRDERGWEGALVKNPNCSTITMVPTLAALSGFGLERVRVATLQAVSGAGYTGVASTDIIDNAIPHIGGEEAKMESESRKLLGEFDGREVRPRNVSVAASCNRIPTIDGHLENVFVALEDDPDPGEVRDAMASYPGADLPSAPDRPVRVFGPDKPGRPQPRLDREVDGGMGVVAGGVKSTDDGVAYNCLAHNTLRGAAGASLLNAELLVAEGWV